MRIYSRLYFSIGLGHCVIESHTPYIKLNALEVCLYISVVVIQCRIFTRPPNSGIVAITLSITFQVFFSLSKFVRINFSLLLFKLNFIQTHGKNAFSSLITFFNQIHSIFFLIHRSIFSFFFERDKLLFN